MTTNSSLDRQVLVDALGDSALPVLGRSRCGIPIRGGWCGGDAGARRLPGLSARRLLMVGGLHGDEPSSAEALLRMVERIRDTSAWNTIGVFVVPGLNPDGLSRGQKDAASGVDLNRNFPARNFTPRHPPGYDPGPFALSEPETALLADVIREHEIDAVVAVHAPFACVNYDGPARAWAERVAQACGWPVRESIGYPTPGSLGSWLGVDAGIPILTLELPPGPLHLFREAAESALDAAAMASDGATT